MEEQKRCDEIKLNCDFNTTKMFETKEINGYMSKNKICNKVKLHTKVKSFGCFPPSNDNFNILPF